MDEVGVATVVEENRHRRHIAADPDPVLCRAQRDMDDAVVHLRQPPITEVFYSTYYFWLILLMATPVMTMRSFALEKYSGTFETLMTAPISDGEVVLATRSVREPLLVQLVLR